MKMLDLYIKLKNPDMPWFDAAEEFVHSRQNVKRAILERELSGEAHLYFIHGYQADGHIITWYEIRNKTTGAKVGPDSHYGFINDGDLEAHVIYCRLMLDDTVYQSAVPPDDLDLAAIEVIGTA